MRTGAFLALALPALVALALADAGQLHAQSVEPTRVTVRITDDGFDGIPEGFTLRFEEGEVVELTFVWDQQLFPEDAHIFVIEGYDIESDEINFYNRESTVRFVADKPGTFRLKCDLDCEIHDVLKAGRIEIGRGTDEAVTGPAANAPPTVMTLAAPVAALAGDAVEVKATVLDESGAPVVGGLVTLYEVAGFLQAEEQEVAVASAVTDAEGVATMQYLARRDGAIALNAYLEGSIDHASSFGTLALNIRSPSSSLYQVAAPTSIPGVNRFLLVAIMAGIWGTMLIVALHVVLIAREGARASEAGDG